MAEVRAQRSELIAKSMVYWANSKDGGPGQEVFYWDNPGLPLYPVTGHRLNYGQ
jgi:hypothetical protein